MMGRQSGQMSMIILDLSELIPENHLLRKINQMISVDFIYDLEAPYYPANGRPSVGPVSMFKMLLVGYLYGVKSERRLVQEVQLNIVYRWFCGFELTDKIPDHSTFSKTRLRTYTYPFKHDIPLFAKRIVPFLYSLSLYFFATASDTFCIPCMDFPSVSSRRLPALTKGIPSSQ